MTLKVGALELRSGLFVAPMAGITDRPFRRLARRFGAALAVSEMLSSRPELRESRKTRLRMDHTGEPGPISVQIAGSDPAQLADAARFNVAHGAEIIDINMGCPAKKVCNVAAGSALLQDEPLVAAIVAAVVAAVAVPVTLKIRTGWNRQNRNAVRIARIAEDAGIAALSVHGRTRECAFVGPVEYETIRAIKRVVGIPVIANGDIDSPEKAREVLSRTGADAIMIGRAAQGRPWIFREIEHYLASSEHLPAPEVGEIHGVLVQHLHALYAFYGEHSGVRVARKHISWYTSQLAGAAAFRRAMIRLEIAGQQLDAVDRFFTGLAGLGERLTYIEELAA